MENTYYPLLWEEWIPKGDLKLEIGKTYLYSVFLKANGKTKYLRIEPIPQRCLGLPALYLEAILKDQRNKIIVEHSGNQPIEGYSTDIGNCHYFEQIPFEILKDGDYNLSVTLYSPEISHITLSIREKKDNVIFFTLCFALNAVKN